MAERERKRTSFSMANEKPRLRRERYVGQSETSQQHENVGGMSERRKRSDVAFRRSFAKGLKGFCGARGTHPDVERLGGGEGEERERHAPGCR
eukprot:4028574-Pyramimonas_sp.AAC.1